MHVVPSCQRLNKQYCAKHAVAAREQQRARSKFKRRNLGAASYCFFEGENDGPSPPTLNPSARPEPTKPPSIIGSVREFPVPLPSGAIAAFKIPFPMCEEDFNHYSGLLTAYKTANIKKAEEN